MEEDKKHNLTFDPVFAFKTSSSALLIETSSSAAVVRVEFSSRMKSGGAFLRLTVIAVTVLAAGRDGILSLVAVGMVAVCCFDMSSCC